MSLLIALLSVYIAPSLGAANLPLPKSDCSETAQCSERHFMPGEKVKCFGTYSCEKATFNTDENIKCFGSAGCYHSEFGSELTSEDVFCSGYRACQHASNLHGVDKVACNGLESCTLVRPYIAAPQVLCDGDLTCSNYDLPSRRVMSIYASMSIQCNGIGACREDYLRAPEYIHCDGDVACMDTGIQTPRVECFGKRVCVGSTLRVKEALLGGFLAARGATVAPLDGAETLTIHAFGYHSLTDATINTLSTAATIKAFGYKSLGGSTVNCGPNGSCKVQCRGSSCKGTVINLTPTSDFSVEPAECDPCDEKFKCSNKDPTLPAKQYDTNCPIIYYPNTAPFRNCRPCDEPTEGQQAVAVAAEWAQEKQELDALELADEQRISEYLKGVKAMYAELELPEPEIDEDEDEMLDEDMAALPAVHVAETRLFGMESLPGLKHLGHSKLLVTNLLTALAVFVLCGAAICFMYTRHVMAKDTYKTLEEV